MNICMLAIAGQTDGPNGLKFFEETHWCPEVKKAKISFFFYKNRNSKFFFSTGNDGHLVSNISALNLRIIFKYFIYEFKIFRFG